MNSGHRPTRPGTTRRRAPDPRRARGTTNARVKPGDVVVIVDLAHALGDALAAAEVTTKAAEAGTP